MCARYNSPQMRYEAITKTCQMLWRCFHLGFQCYTVIGQSNPEKESRNQRNRRTDYDSQFRGLPYDERNPSTIPYIEPSTFCAHVCPVFARAIFFALYLFQCQCTVFPGCAKNSSHVVDNRDCLRIKNHSR